MEPKDQKTTIIVQQSQALPALCSFFIPGLGQIIQGRVLDALLTFLAVCLFWLLGFALLFLFPLGILIGPVGNIWAAVDAAKYAP